MKEFSHILVSPSEVKPEFTVAGEMAACLLQPIVRVF